MKILIGIAFVVVAAAPFFFLDIDGRREPLAIVSSDAGDFVIVLVRDSNHAEGTRSRSWTEYEAYSLEDGRELGSLDDGYPGKLIGNVGDAAWIDVMRNAGLVDMRSGRWLIHPANVAQRWPALGEQLNLCHPQSSAFNGPMNLETGALCVVGTNGLTYFLGMDGDLVGGDDVELPPERTSPCPPKHWWVRETDECIGRTPHAQGGFALTSSRGWTTEFGLLKSELLRGRSGWAQRLTDAELLLVRHEPLGGGVSVTALTPDGKTAWSVDAAALGHQQPDVDTTKTRLVLSSRVGGEALVSAIRLADGSLERTLEL